MFFIGCKVFKTPADIITLPGTGIIPDNAEIILTGTGTTNLIVQMLDNDINYNAELDEINCNNEDCNFTQDNGKLNFNLNLDSEHTITIYPA